MNVYRLEKPRRNALTVNIGKKLKVLRKAAQLSQEELAVEVGINPNHLSRLERGVFQPSVEVLKRLADRLEVTVDYLLSDDDARLPEVNLTNKTLAEQLRLLDQLEAEDQQAVVRVIETMLTKYRMQQLLEGDRKLARG